MPAGDHGSCFHHLELDICFDEYNYHDSLQACGIEEIGHFIVYREFSNRFIYVAGLATSTPDNESYGSGNKNKPMVYILGFSDIFYILFFGSSILLTNFHVHIQDSSAERNL